MRKDIYIIRYLNGERNFPNEITIFDYYEVEAATNEETADEVLRLLNEHLRLNILENHTSITRIEASKEDLIKLQAFILSSSLNMGADDDTFDYFPDLVFAFQQICEHFEDKDIYNETVKKLNKDIYDELEDSFELLK